jgi:hypothetical protein
LTDAIEVIEAVEDKAFDKGFNEAIECVLGILKTKWCSACGFARGYNTNCGVCEVWVEIETNYSSRH